MKIDAISVTSTNLKTTVRFYSLLGFVFSPLEGNEDHIEPQRREGEVRLMIDTTKLTESLCGSKPVPSNHSTFAILCNNPAEVDAICTQIKEAGFSITKEPWDAFWGQRYASVQDPDGYKIDLFAPLK